jgi:O-antigen ligase
MLLIVCITAYLILAIGRVIPYDSEDVTKAVAGGVIFSLCVAYLLTARTNRIITTVVISFACAALIILLIGSFPSEYPGYFFDKIQGGILSATMAFFGLSNCYLRHGIQKTHKMLVISAVAILILTIVYKLNFGFFDRSVRFLINGPIVFGWIAGLFCIMCFQLHSELKKRWYGLLGCLFLVVVLWTQSKGPLIALFIVLGYSNIGAALKHKYKAALIGSFIIMTLVVNFEAVDLILSETRFSVVTRILSGQMQDSDEGSVGVRGELLDHAILQIEKHPITGIGLGQFEHLGFKYPHNQHLEIATELGIPAFVLHLGLIGYCLYFSHRNFRSFIFFFFIAGLFSGDMSYLRFLYTFALLGLTSRAIQKRNLNMHQLHSITPNV